ncbi:MAG: GTPase Era [Oscillospiraceae bacterium]|jgi:GTP-binding protein Era|nr:GTPase Era [Oscillospiraceae bacterium]
MGDTQAAFIAIVGKPNVGKSSLLNRLIGAKIAIVTNKPQTTRMRISGVLTTGKMQFVFTDTPGLCKPKTQLGNYMVSQVFKSISDVDLVAFVAEAIGDKIASSELTLLNEIQKQKQKVILILSKIDKLKDKSKILHRMELFKTEYDFSEIIPVSAFTGDGIADLLNVFESYSTKGPHFFPEGSVTNQPEKFIVAEIVRERILMNLSEEVPHSVAVVTEKIKKRSKSELIDIDVHILCDKKNHKGIIIGKNGEMLKKIATESRLEIVFFLGRKVNLQCWVKVKEGWRNKKQLFESLGLT